jgi:electron transfer flavoprotein beta subunit
MSPVPFSTSPGPGLGPVEPSPVVVACVRITDLRPEVDPLLGTVRRHRWGVGLSAPDAAAVEHALRIAESWSGRAVVVTVGPPSVDPVLSELAALGASVVRIDDGQVPDDAYPTTLAADERTLASAVASALIPYGPPDLVICGDRSADRGTGAFPAYLAHELQAAQALGLVTLSTEGRSLLAERRLDGGWRERLRVPCPAVCSVEGAGIRLRRAPLAHALAAGQQSIPVVGPGTVDRPGTSHGPAISAGAARPFRPRTRVLAAPSEPDPRLRLLALTGALVDHEPPTVVGPVDAVQAADALIAYLVRHRYLDQVPEMDGPEAAAELGGALPAQADRETR